MTAFQKVFKHRRLILASNSPRRRELFALLGVPFEVEPAEIEELIPPGAHPETLAAELARQKAMARCDKYDNAIVVGADTLVVLGERILGKPRDAHEAATMLASLSGNTHQVYTGVAIVCRPEQRIITGVEVTDVTFRTLAEEEIQAYIRTGQPFDKAGAYGIQDQSAVFVNYIRGCFYNVVGFPLARFYQMILEHFSGSD